MEQLGYRILSPFFVLLCLGGARLNIRFNLCFEQPSSFYLNTNSFLTIDPPHYSNLSNQNHYYLNNVGKKANQSDTSGKE